jgi:hypothetical protein
MQFGNDQSTRRWLELTKGVSFTALARQLDRSAVDRVT